MLRDFEFFKSKLQHIDGFGNTGDYLIDIIKAKQVKSASPPPPPPSESKSEEKQGIEATKDAPKGQDNAENSNSTVVEAKS